MGLLVLVCIYKYMLVRFICTHYDDRKQAVIRPTSEVRDSKQPPQLSLIMWGMYLSVGILYMNVNSPSHDTNILANSVQPTLC
jgi:hypothetical protein